MVRLLRLEIFLSPHPHPGPSGLSQGDGWECASVASPLGNYKTELYDPAMEKYQPSPQWINLFVFVKDPENKVRQAFTPCSTPKVPASMCGLLWSLISHRRMFPDRQVSSRRAMVFAILYSVFK